MFESLPYFIKHIILVCSGFLAIPKYKNPKLLTGKTVIITGANGGLGKEATKQFYKRGARVVMACRDVEDAKSVAEFIKFEIGENKNGGDLVIYPLDLSSLAETRKSAEEILKNEERIDILLNNAGIIADIEERTQDGYGLVFGVNYLGPFLFTLLLLPRIIKTGSARIINIASIGHVWADKIHFDDLDCKKPHTNYLHGPFAYGVSKKANIFFIKELARRLKAVNADVTTYSMHPGICLTGLFKYNPFSKFFQPFTDFMLKIVEWFMHKPEDCFQTTLYCSIDEKSGQESGLFYSRRGIASKWIQPADNGQSKRLWDASLKMCGLESDLQFFVKR